MALGTTKALVLLFILIPFFTSVTIVLLVTSTTFAECKTREEK